MNLRIPVGSSRGKAWLWRMTGLLLIFGLLCSGGMAGALDQDQSPPPPGPSEFHRAPMRPRSEHQLPPRTGLIPPPMDLSHLTGQETMQGRSAQALPSEFDWRDQGKVTPVKDQGACGSCYAFGYLGSFESRLLIDGAGTFDLSENHAKECNWRELRNFQGGTSCDGGNAFDMTNLFTQEGTVLESCDPYKDKDVSCKSGCAHEQTILDWRLINGVSVPSPAVLKQYVYEQGPIITSMYADRSEFEDYDGSYTLNYSAPGDDTDHCVLIVGWSDSLPPEPGSTSPASGWIVKNSWGAGWGDNGFFYIAYGAANIGMVSSFVHDWQAYDASGDLWFYDESGWEDSWGCTSSQTAWGLAKFIADKDTSVTRVEFWTTDRTTDIDVYLYDGFDGDEPFGLLASKLNNAFSEAGYHSVLLDRPVPLTSGDDVVAVVKFTNASYDYPLAADSNGRIETGRTYLSCGGTYWDDMGEVLDTDMAIRLRTGASGPVGSLLAYLPVLLRQYSPSDVPPTSTPTTEPPPTVEPEPGPEPGTWTGTTNRGRPMSFDVSEDGTEWSVFKLEARFNVGRCSGTMTSTIFGPGAITNNEFSQSGTFSFSGQFTSSTKASGVYAYTDHNIAGCGDFNQTGTWTAEAP